MFCPRSKLLRDQDRDISELIALGKPNPRITNEAQYDQRLFNQNKVNPFMFTIEMGMIKYMFLEIK